MYAYNHSTPGSHATPEYALGPTFAPPPGFVGTPLPPGTPLTVPPGFVPFPHAPTPPTPVLAPVQVPPGCYPIELVQFWRDEYKHGQALPLHWALFVRITPSTTSTSSSPPHPRPRLPPTPVAATAAAAHAASVYVTQHGPSSSPRGNVYELVGSPDTYTAQFLSGVAFAPEALPDWRGSHVIGWVHPASLGAFERGVGQVKVWRQRPDWRSQQWAYEVLRVVGEMRASTPGVFVEGVTWSGLQRQMGRLLEAWENGDI